MRRSRRPECPSAIPLARSACIFAPCAPRVYWGVSHAILPTVPTTSPPPDQSRSDPSRDHAAVATSIDAFRRILRALRLSAREVQSASGLTAAQLFVLSALADGVPLSLNELAERTMTDRSSVSAVVDRLGERGLLVRRQSQRDRRRAEVALTARGRAIVRRAPPAPTSLLIGGLEAMPALRLRQLSTALTTLIAEMGVADGAATMLFEDEPAAPAVRRRAPRVTA